MPAGEPRRSLNTGVFSRTEDDIALAVNAFLVASKRADEGFANADKEKRQHLRTIQGRYWRNFFTLLSANMARNRNRIDFTEEERFYIDFGLVDARMMGLDTVEIMNRLSAELHAPGAPGAYYLSEWLWHRYQQFQLEDTVSDAAIDDDGAMVSQLVEARQRVLNRLAEYFTGLPGIPREVSESMRSGELDDAVLNLGINLLRKSSRPYLLRRRNLWQLREQVMAKARARTGSQNSLKLFEALNEIYARDWRERYDRLVSRATAILPEAAPVQADDTVSVSMTITGQVMLEARQMRMRAVLGAAINGETHMDTVLHVESPRLTKEDIAGFIPLVQSFDRSFTELPPIVIFPGAGRGIFAWDSGCVILALRPSVGADDSLATAFAFQHMLDDFINRGGELKSAYEAAFPGSNFNNDFPVDYRAWLCRLTNGDASAMSPERRAFFRERIGPDLSGPMLPVNLRNIGPQSLDVICRRLEKQIASGEKDYKLNRRLAALYWHQGNMEAAAMQFTAAMQHAPNDGETLFTAGMFTRANQDAVGAKSLFSYGAERASNTLWGVYCRDALDGMF